MNDEDSLRVLSELDKGTEWVESGDLLAANDPNEDDGLAGVYAFPHLHPIDGGAEAEVDTMDDGESASNIAKTVVDMVQNGVVEDLVVIVNTPEGEQVLMTTINRNDHIIGCLTVATMNWHSSQIAASNFYEEDE
jgi:hypothetical protein